MKTTAEKWERYTDGEYYANINGCHCWVLRVRKGWVADVYDSTDDIVEYVRPHRGIPMSFAEAKERAFDVAMRHAGIVIE